MKWWHHAIVYVLCFGAGLLVMYLRGKSEDAETIDAEHRQMVITVTVEKKDEINRLQELNAAKDTAIMVLQQANINANDRISSLTGEAVRLKNDLTAINERLPKSYDFGHAGNVDSAASRLLSRLPGGQQ